MKNESEKEASLGVKVIVHKISYCTKEEAAASMRT
jgi:hypothetical protein